MTYLTRLYKIWINTIILSNSGKIKNLNRIKNTFLKSLIRVKVIGKTQIKLQIFMARNLKIYLQKTKIQPPKLKAKMDTTANLHLVLYKYLFRHAVVFV